MRGRVNPARILPTSRRRPPRRTPAVLFVPVVLCATALISGGCGTVPAHVLALFGDADTLTVAEYEETYLRLRNTKPETREQKEAFLDRLVDFKVKVKEARARGIDRLPDVVGEIREYRDKLAVQTVLDERLVGPATRTLYDRRAEEVRFAHILVRWRRFPGGIVDSATTREHAQTILNKALAGEESFDTLIARYSEDGLKRFNNGIIGWVIAGTTLPQVDDIVYTIPVGTVYPALMLTHYGLHIVKLLGRQKARQRVRASQILYRLDVNNPLDTAAGYARMSLILDSLKRGLATFEELARRNSMDPESGAKGGDMGWVDRGMYLEEHFEEALFNVPLGEVSPVVRSAFGMHIIKVTDEAPPPPYEEQKSALREIYMRERFAADYERLMRGLRSAYRYRFHENVARRLITRMDSGWTTSTPGWDLRLTPEDREAFLFSLGDDGVPLHEVVREIKREPDLQMRPFTIPALDSIAVNIADRRILLRESAGLEERAPAFRRLMDEFRESSWVSRLEQEAVWDSVRVSDEEARRYWEAHRAEFRWPDRVAFSEIHVYSDVEARKLLDSLKAGASFADLASRHTRRTGMFQKGGSWGLQPVNLNDLSRAAAQLEIGQVSGIIPQDPGVSIVRTDAKDPAREKTFEEARSEVLARAKEEAAARRLRELTDELRKRYRVRTFPDHLDAAFAGTR